MGNLPKNWVQTDLPSLIDNKGIFTDGDWVESKDQDPEGDVRLIQLADIGINEFRNKSNRYLNTETSIRLKCSFIAKGDVLIARMPDPIGRACIFPLDGKNVTVVDVAFARFNPKYVSNKLVMNFINSPYFNNNIQLLATGTTRKRISRKNLATIPLPLPPLAEQQRIVAKLDTLFGHLDSLKQRLELIPTLLKQFRQSVLTQAVTGKLTEEWREGKELGEVDFERIESNRLKHYQNLVDNAKIKGKPKPKKPFNIDLKIQVEYDIEFIKNRIPETWAYLPLVKVTNNNPDSIVDGPFGSSINVKKDYLDSGVKVIRMVNIRPFRFVNENLKFLRESKFQELKRHNIRANDILLAKVGATIGDCCLFPADEKEAILSTTGSCRMRVDEEICSAKYLELYINSQVSNLKGIASQTAQPFLNMKTIKAFPISVPPLKEQTEIVKRVEALFSKAETIEAAYDKLKQQIDTLPQAILAKAFKGELVEQLPTDGDAKELLKEIEALRATLDSKKK